VNRSLHREEQGLCGMTRLCREENLNILKQMMCI